MRKEINVHSLVAPLQNQIEEMLRGEKDNMFLIVGTLVGKLILEGEGSQISAGDYDVYAELIRNTPDLKLLYMKDVSTCSDRQEWLVWLRMDTRKDIVPCVPYPEIYVRSIWNKHAKEDPTDFLPRSKKSPTKPTLEWWGKRDSSILPEDRFDNTLYDGVYGDGRDPGKKYL